MPRFRRIMYTSSGSAASGADARTSSTEAAGRGSTGTDGAGGSEALTGRPNPFAPGRSGQRSRAGTNRRTARAIPPTWRESASREPSRRGVPPTRPDGIAKNPRKSHVLASRRGSPEARPGGFGGMRLVSPQLQTDQPGDAFAMIRRITEREFRRLRPLEVEVQVVLPGEADAAVELDAPGGHAAEGVRTIGLGHRRGQGC